MELVLNGMHGRRNNDVGSMLVDVMPDIAPVDGRPCTLFENASRLLEHLHRTEGTDGAIPCADALLTSKHFLGIARLSRVCARCVNQNCKRGGGGYHEQL